MWASCGDSAGRRLRNGSLGNLRAEYAQFCTWNLLAVHACLDYAEQRPTVLANRRERNMRRARPQKGRLQRVKSKYGEAVWIFRWYEVQLNGTKRYRKAVIGSVSDYKTEAEAQKAADALRLEINEQTPRQQLRSEEHTS